MIGRNPIEVLEDHMGRTILQHLDDFVQFISQRLLARLAKTRPDFVTDIWPVSRVPLGSMFGRGESEELNNWPGVLLVSTFRRRDSPPVTTRAPARLLVQIAPSGSRSKA